MNLEEKGILGAGMTSLRTRQRLVERLTEQGIKDIRILEVIRDTPRHLFLDEALSSRAYEDLALPIGYRQTISQPYVVARMTEVLIESKKLESKPINKALEIGTGCGYQTAILSRFSNSVDSIERIKALHDKAIFNLNNLKIKNVRFLLDDGEGLQNYNDEYDAILVAAAPQEVPSYLLNKLTIDGRLICPVGDRKSQKLTFIKRLSKNEYETLFLDDVLFVPMLKGLVE